MGGRERQSIGVYVIWTNWAGNICGGRAADTYYMVQTSVPLKQKQICLAGTLANR